MKKVLPLLLLLFPLNARAQSRMSGRYFEAGGMLGLTSYSGDVAAKRVDLQELRPGYGAFVRYHLDPHFALRAHFYGGTISGDDKYSSVKAPRSIKFGTSLVEVATCVEFHLFGRNTSYGTGLHDFLVSPYVFAGIGGTFADANAEYYGPPESRDKLLKVPLPEEGLKSVFLLAPVGGGVRLDFYERFIFGLEGGFRPVFSDGIDGVSQNGNPNRNDWYYFFGLTISYVLSGPSY